jgi:DNA recombination protein RmuC
MWIVEGLLLLNIGLLIWLIKRTESGKVDVTAPIRQTLGEEIFRFRTEINQSGKMLRDEVGQSMHKGHDLLGGQLQKMSESQLRQLEVLSKQWISNAENHDQRMRDLQKTVDDRLLHIERQSAERLEKMRATVEEKLEGTLERRLGESFKMVGERLELVQRGLGEMQALASGVGDLKKVLTNVKTRGTWGEVQLSMLLEQILTPDQYVANAKLSTTAENVEFAVKLPGRNDDDEPVFLPIDSKFPQESYQRLIEASESGNADLANIARKELEAAVRNSAKDIREKYIHPPKTTDFAVMFLPTEGLYAEVLRTPGMLEKIQNEQRVIISGPTTLAALLNSLQMGFRTMAIQKRSSEVWKILAVIKAEFGKFGDILEAVHKKLGEATGKIEDATRKTRTIQTKLRNVEELPQGSSQASSSFLND